MRPIWNGHITFGLISIPVALHSAVEASERVSFRMLHRKDKARIVFKKFCSKEDVEVPNDEIVKGYGAASKRSEAVHRAPPRSCVEGRAGGPQVSRSGQTAGFVPSLRAPRGTLLANFWGRAAGMTPVRRV